jgi:hypothetical protein
VSIGYLFMVRFPWVFIGRYNVSIGYVYLVKFG